MSFIKFFSLFIFVLTLSACSLFRTSDDWPEQLPPQVYFMDYYHNSSDNHAYQEQDNYLNWIRIFYFGNPLAPGWLQLTEDLLVETPENKQQEYTSLMTELGKRIGAEWAQDNRVRLIDSRMAIAWRDALIEAVSLGDLDAYLQRFDADVNAVLAGNLDKEAIQLSRYYEEQKFEFF